MDVPLGGRAEGVGQDLQVEVIAGRRIGADRHALVADRAGHLDDLGLVTTGGAQSQSISDAIRQVELGIIAIDPQTDIRVRITTGQWVLAGQRAAQTQCRQVKAGNGHFAINGNKLWTARQGSSAHAKKVHVWDSPRLVNPLAGALQGHRASRDIGNVTQIVGGIGVRAELDARVGEGGIIVIVHTDFHGHVVVAGLAEIIAEDAKVEIIAGWDDRVALITRRANVVGESDALAGARVIDDLQVVGVAGIVINGGEVRVYHGWAGTVGGRKLVDVRDIAKRPMLAEGYGMNGQPVCVVVRPLNADGAAVDPAIG